MKRGLIALLIAMAVPLLALSCGVATEEGGVIDLSYSLARTYTGESTNTFTITATEATAADYEFSITTTDATPSIEQEVYNPLTSQTIEFSYDKPGVLSADFRIRRTTGEPYLYEILTWEYSTDPPDEPVISFSADATSRLSNVLLISENRDSNVTAIWIGGDVDTTGKTELEDGGYWQSIVDGQVSITVTVTPGDGVKNVEGKFRNIYGNVSEAAIPADITLKQKAPTNCTAEAVSSTIGNNKLDIKMGGTDTGPLSYTIRGDVRLPKVREAFSDQDIVSVYTEPSEGTKNVTVYIEDIAGNFCLEKVITVVLDTGYESEGIFVQNATYWTDSEDILLDIFFEHFEDEEPLQLKITGDVSGDNAFKWVAYETGIPVTLNPSTSGNRNIRAQYRDKDGNESYLISKRIFLKPEVTLTEVSAPNYTVTISQIRDLENVTITGCAETYNAIAYAASYACELTDSEVSVTYGFDSGSDLTLTASP